MRLLDGVEAHEGLSQDLAHQVQLILHAVFERVGERRVTGRDFGEYAAAPATSKDAARIA